ncbi:hypothetical protein BOO71_0011131 [Deinococcus marmoris]|uniref:Uncharacterized protein n=1 Tax=Deinococcus marmoris TaxID=249408 RepID=A0A1U7NUV3_9DEIO|nr:hypothetical protein BOO71_0011131 [Deinococcus marmoris]
MVTPSIVRVWLGLFRWGVRGGNGQQDSVLKVMASEVDRMLKLPR